MTVTATVECEGLDKDTLRRRLEAAGFTVARVSVKSAPAGNVTPMIPGQRASARTDMPEGLDDHEQRAYVRGYAKGAVNYGKKNAAPTGSGDGSGKGGAWVKSDWTALRWACIQYEWDRHPACHKAAMTELRKWQSHWAAYQADVAARRAAKAPKRRRKVVAA